MGPKFDEEALAKEIVEAATNQYKDKLTDGRDFSVGIVQIDDYLPSVVDLLKEHCQRFQLKVCVTNLSKECGQNAIQSNIRDFNKNNSVIGILLLMADDCAEFQLDADIIEPTKDIAGITSANLSRFDSGETDGAVPMAKAYATLKIIKKKNLMTN